MEDRKEEEMVAATDELKCLMDYTKGVISFDEYQKRLAQIRRDEEAQIKKYGLLEE